MVPIATSDTMMILIHGIVAISAESNSGALCVRVAGETLKGRIVMPGSMPQIVDESRMS